MLSMIGCDRQQAGRQASSSALYAATDLPLALARTAMISACSSHLSTCEHKSFDFVLPCMPFVATSCSMWSCLCCRHGFLSTRLSFSQLLGFGLALFAAASNDARLNLLKCGIPGKLA